MSQVKDSGVDNDSSSMRLGIELPGSWLYCEWPGARTPLVGGARLRGEDSVGFGEEGRVVGGGIERQEKPRSVCAPVVRDYRDTSLIRIHPPPRTTIGP